MPVLPGMDGNRRMSDYDRLSREELIALLVAARPAEDAVGYRNSVEQASDGIFFADQRGVYLDVNEAGARILGMAREEVIGLGIADIVVHEELDQVLPRLSRVLAGETIIHEWRMKKKDGTIFSAEVSAKVLSDGRLQGILRDVTVRKQAEQALRGSMERFQALTAASFEGICITDEGVIVEANDQLAEMLGHERSELLGKRVMSFVAPASRTLVENRIGSGVEGPYEHLALRKDGSELRVEVRAKSIDTGGRVVRVTAIRDISEQRLLQDTIHSLVQGTSVVGQEFFRALVRGVATAIGARYAFVAELVEERLGYARTIALWADDALAENISYSLADSPYQHTAGYGPAFHPRDARKLFPNDPLVARFGAESYLSVPLLTASGEPVGLLVALHDRPLEHAQLASSVLTIFAGRAAAELERLRADQALRSSEESLRATIDTAPHVAVQWYDATGRVLLWNRASEQTFGWSAAEALGKTLDQLILSPSEAREFTRTLAELEASGEPTGTSEHGFRRRDGSEGWRLSTMFRIPDANGRSRFARMDVDVSERRRVERERAELEDQLRHRQKLDALGTLAGGIAHDFNNILAVIIACTELASLDIEDPDQAGEHLAEVRKAAERARDLVRHILAFSRRQEHERVVLRPEPVIDEVCKFLRATLPATIEMDVLLDPRAPPVLANAGQLHQVVMNLCTNAAHAMKARGGRLTVAVEPAEVDPDAEGSPAGLAAGLYLKLTVGDTGHGMDPATTKRIFEPFFTTKNPDEGTGLGLSVVHGIVRDHDGAITVKSVAGRGTSFVVYVPAQRRPIELNREPVYTSELRGAGESILFVDDEAALCRSSRMVLERAGYRVITYRDPLLALEEVRRNPHAFELVITDLTMPLMTGIELARLVIEQNPQLKVLLTSGFSGSLTSADARKLGIFELLAKPLSPEALTAAVHHALASG